MKVRVTIAQIQQLLKKYRPDQARVPRGSREGGQFADEGRSRVAGKWDESRREDCEVQYEKDMFQCRMMPWNPFCENQAMVRLVACMKGDPIPPFFHAM
jgi:hypothetical protein